MSPYEACKLYLALRQHFTSSYNFFKYNGKVKLDINAYSKRRDKIQCAKLAKKDDPLGFIVSNMLERDIKWAGDLLDDKSNDTYLHWLSRTQAITYVFQNELESISEDFISHFKVKDGQYPALLKLFKQNKISPETLVILNDILNFFPYWDEKISDEHIWPKIKTRLLKYKPFMVYNKNNMKKQVKNVLDAQKAI
jgi:hypothetical protein